MLALDFEWPDYLGWDMPVGLGKDMGMDKEKEWGSGMGIDNHMVEY